MKRILITLILLSSVGAYIHAIIVVLDTGCFVNGKMIAKYNSHRSCREECKGECRVLVNEPHN